jgi:O-antigen ligase
MAAAQSSLARTESGSQYLWILAAIGLVAFGAASGVAIAFGETGAFYITLSVILAAAILVDFRLGAVVLIVVLPLSQTNLFPHSMFGVPALNPFNILIMATLASYALRDKIASLAPRPLVWLYVLPILIAGLMGMPHVDEILPYFFERDTLRFTGPWGYFLDFTIRPLLIVAVAMLVGVAVRRSQRPERFIVAIMISVWLIALTELVSVALANVRLGSLASAGARTFFAELFGLHANDLGRLFAIAYALLLFVWWETKSAALKSALFVTLGVISLALLLTFSRGGFLGFFLASALFVLWKFNAKTVSLALIAMLFAVVLMPEPLYDRLTFGWEEDVNAVSAGRIEGIWLPLLPELARSPIWGSGIGSTMWSQPLLNGAMLIVGHPHNAYLEAALDMGFLGLGLLLAYSWHVWKGLRALGSNAYLSPEMRGFFQGACAALLVLLVTAWTGSSLRPEIEFGFLWVAIGMMYGMLARKPTAQGASR